MSPFAQLAISVGVSLLILPIMLFLVGFQPRAFSQYMRLQSGDGLQARHVNTLSHVGILQLLWLLKNNPEPQEHLVNTLAHGLKESGDSDSVEEMDPTQDQLRSAGMFPVRLADESMGDSGYRSRTPTRQFSGAKDPTGEMLQ